MIIYPLLNISNGNSLESEIIWVPEGAGTSQWNMVKGKVVVTKLNLDKKLIPGMFEFKVEKFECSSNGNS